MAQSISPLQPWNKAEGSGGRGDIQQHSTAVTATWPATNPLSLPLSIPRQKCSWKMLSISSGTDLKSFLLLAVVAGAKIGWQLTDILGRRCR